MQKIITLFQRNYETDRLVRDEIVPGAEWVLEGEGVATRKFDGTCAMIRGDKLYRRYDLKAKKGRLTPPPDWEPAEPEPDPVTSSWPGWVPVKNGTDDQYFIEAWGRLATSHIVSNLACSQVVDGTYELIGPKVQGNPEHWEYHVLMRHGAILLLQNPRDFECIRDYLRDRDIEGIVWHHDDGRMVKIKKRDFGFKRV